MRLSKCVHGVVRSVVVPQGRNNFGWVLMRENSETILTGRINSNMVNPAVEADCFASSGKGRSVGKTYKEAVESENGHERMATENNTTVGNSNWSWVVACERQVLHQTWSDIRLALTSWLDKEVELFPYQINRAFFVCDSKEEAIRVNNTGKLAVEGQTDVLLYSWERGLENNIPKIVSYGGWLGVSGLPMHWWRKDFFERIGNECGGLIELDQRTEDFKYLFEARIKTRKNHVGFLPEIVILNEGSESYFVKIRPLSPAIRPTNSRFPPPKMAGGRKPVEPSDGGGLFNHGDFFSTHVEGERGNHIEKRNFEGTEKDCDRLAARTLECGSGICGIGRLPGLLAPQLEPTTKSCQLPVDLVRRSTNLGVKKSCAWAFNSGPKFGPASEAISEPNPAIKSVSNSGPGGNCDPILNFQGNVSWAGPAQHETRFRSKFRRLSGRKTISKRRGVSSTHDVRPGHEGEFATISEERQGDESCDSVDGRSIASVGTEKDDLPSEVEETVDVIESDDRSVARILTGLTDGMVLEGHGGLEDKNCEEDDKVLGKETGGEAGPLNSQDIEGGNDDGVVGEKTKEVEFVSYSRRKSLVTSLYKMVSKVLASRLREVLGSTISSYQSAFVQGRQILDAVLIANEVVEESRRLNKSGMVFKIDLEKAYDHVEWRFVNEVLIRKGFGDRWRSWIRGCLETANFSMMINGRPRGKFRASRGLRQGDPFSPFLFTLDYKGVGVAELWDRVKFWAALWASTSLAFKDVPYPSIMRNLLAVVS
ncbi:hypothetical protein L3X38_002710 [Prunus dulcis]|uniref:Reverse transcriptase domain-containing protein n=1 Tax=Prunus dulcis TaxID=3755 RepID=A0AAD4ZL99_PRUDU|nr:hypothetical protein L3X38_002710 [Prunus dulcis]